jgi:hypothetical protein
MECCGNFEGNHSLVYPLINSWLFGLSLQCSQAIRRALKKWENLEQFLASLALLERAFVDVTRRNIALQPSKPSVLMHVASRPLCVVILNYLFVVYSRFVWIQFQLHELIVVILGINKRKLYS